MRVGGLLLEVTEGNGALRIALKGKSAERDPETTVGPFLAAQRSRARATRSRMDLHFEELEFFNSATMSLLIEYIQTLRQEKVPVRILYANKGRWQRIFFDALRMFEASGVLELVEVRA